MVEINLQGGFKGSKTLLLVLVIPVRGSGEAVQACEGCGCEEGGLVQDCQEQWVQRPTWKTHMSRCPLLGWDNETEAHGMLEMELWVLACFSRIASLCSLCICTVQLQRSFPSLMFSSTWHLSRLSRVISFLHVYLQWCLGQDLRLLG